MYPIEMMARIIQAEAGSLSYEGKLAVAQCIIDNEFNYDAFTTPADSASDECYKAARAAVKGERRFTNYKLLQFRSFTRYSNGHGEPDLSKIYSGKCPMPKEYIYLGKDGQEPWGHFYYGVAATPELKDELKLTIIYDGADGVNLRSDPTFKNNIVGVLHAGGSYIVIDKTEDGNFYKLKSGVYISSRPDLVRVYEGKLVNYMVRVDIDDLNIRKGHGTNYANYEEPIPKGAYTIVETCKGLGSITGWGLLKAYSEKRNGWISLDFVDKIK